MRGPRRTGGLPQSAAPAAAPRLPEWTQDAVGSRPAALGWLESLGGDALPAGRWVRRFLLAFACLAAADVAVRRAIPAPDFGADYTMPYNGLARLGAYVRYVRERRAAGRRVVVFLGDSSARSRIPAGSPTLAQSFASRLAAEPGGAGAEVYNFSVAGLDPASKFYIAAALADRVDALVLTINFRGFEAGPRRAVPYPELWFELRPALTAPDRAHLAAPPSAGDLSALAGVEADLEDGLGNACALWGRRVELKDRLIAWFHPAQWIARWRGRTGPSPWDGPLAGFPPALRASWLGAYAKGCGGDPPSAGSADLYFLGRLFALARPGGPVVLAYAAPFSRSLNARERFFPPDLYAADVAAVRRIVPAGGRVRFLDYNGADRPFDPQPADRYSQGFEHWTADGLARLADRLVRDFRDPLREALR